VTNARRAPVLDSSFWNASGSVAARAVTVPVHQAWSALTGAMPTPFTRIVFA